MATVVRINAQNSSIVIESEESCAVFDGNMNIFTTKGYKAVTTKNNSGNITLTCIADGVPNNGASVKIYDYTSTQLPCVFKTGEELHTTNNWKEILSPDGHVSYICHFTK